MHPPDFSDHSLIVAKLPLTKPKPTVFSATGRGWKRLNRDAFRRDLEASPLLSSEDWSGSTPDELASLCCDTLANLIDVHAPRSTIKKSYRPITPWYNDACRVRKRKVRVFERKYRKSKSPVDRMNWLAQLRSCQEFYGQVQDVYWQTLISESSGNAKKLWNKLSMVMGKKQRSAVCEDLTAEMFLKGFTDKVQDVRSSTSGASDPDFTEYSGEMFCSFTPLDVAAVRELIVKSPNKSCSLDPIPTWLVKEFAVELAPFITAVINRSLEAGYFPVSFRAAVITPILKKSTLDPAKVSSYRPISNLCYLSKLLERVVKNQLMDYVERNRLLPEHQSAYRACHSTESALLKVTSDALLAADRGMVTLLGSLDLNAAFDCVDHSIFLLRLEHSFGIIGTVLAWTSSYLHDRMQQVRYNGQTSEPCRVTCGVPQGSVLGPVYFLLYTSDVFEIASQHGFQIHGYADDLQLYQSCFPTDMLPLNIRFMGCLEATQSWMTRNRLKLNAARTEVMWMGSARKLKNLSPPEVVFADCVIPISSHVRSLGVIIDSALTFSDHVTRLVNSCFYQLRQIRSVRRSLTIDSAHAIVRVLILSRLDYCNSLLSGLHTAMSIGWCYACGRPAHISAPVQRPRQPSDARSTPLAERCIEDSIQTVRPGVSMSKRCHAIVSRQLLHSSRQRHRSIVSAVCCLR